MQYSLLGNTGLNVSKLCFGTLTMGPIQKNLLPLEGGRLIIHARESGVNFLDTAEFYQNYPHIKIALKEYPDIIVATKCYAYTKKLAEESFFAALKGLGREYIDIFMLHEQESKYTLLGHMEALEFFSKKKEQGYIRALGLSTHFVAGVLAGIDCPLIDVIHPLINLKGIGIADGGREDMLKAMRMAHCSGKGVYAMKPLGGGHLLGQREEALNFARNLDCADSVAIGMQNMDEIDYNIKFFLGQNICEELSKKTAALPREIFIQDWCIGCGNCVNACKGGAISIVDKKALVDKTRCVLCGYCGGRCPEMAIKIF